MTEGRHTRANGRLAPKSGAFDMKTRIAVERTDENVFAHLLTGTPVDYQPGDTVQVQGPEIQAAHGERFTIKRDATVRRAGPLKRWWMRFIAVFEITGLYEVSFSPKKKV